MILDFEKELKNRLKQELAQSTSVNIKGIRNLNSNAANWIKVAYGEEYKRRLIKHNCESY